MSFQVTTAFVQDYKNTVQLLLQQKGSRLRNAVMNQAFMGKAAKAVEQIGSTAAQKRLTRHGDTPLISTPHDARWIYPTDYEWADLIDDQDKLRMLIDPTSSYAQNAANAMGRAQDEEILAAMFGTAKTGENGSTSTAFGTNQVVTVATGGGSATGLNVAKLRAAKKILMANNVDLDSDQFFAAITAEQHDDLLNEVQAVSLDYNTRPVLVDGRITAFMGFNFIHTELVPTGTDDAAGTSRSVPVWAKSGMCFGAWEDMNAQISERSDKGYSTQVYMRQTVGATRLEEGKIVRVWCRE